MKKKKKYRSPFAEVQEFDLKDIIMGSSGAEHANQEEDVEEEEEPIDQ